MPDQSHSDNDLIPPASTLLLVEDDPEHVRLIRAYFSRSSFHPEMIAAASLREAQNLLETLRPDLVVTDYKLSDGLGTELLRVLQDDHPLPVIIISNFGTEELAAEVIKAGAIDYVSKSEQNLKNLPSICLRALREWRHLRQRDQALRALQESERKYRILVETMNEGVCIQDQEGNIVYANGRLCETLDYHRQELTGQPLLRFIKESYQPLLERIFKQELPCRQSFEIMVRRKDRQEVPMLVSPQPFFNENKELEGSFAVFTNITRQKQAEDYLKTSIKEKEILLQEVHHRVKNNLQLICSLLNLQAGQQDDPKLDAIVRECHRRIRVIATIHERLYHHQDLSQIDIGDYIRILAQDLFQSFGLTPQQVRLQVQASSVLLPLDQAIPCSLLANEIITNAFEHAFPDPSPANEVCISICQSGNQVQMEIADNGIGFAAADQTAGQPATLGLVLIEALSHQLKAQMTRSHDSAGTRYQIQFALAN